MALGKQQQLNLQDEGMEGCCISARRAELLNELSNSYENISGFIPFRCYRYGSNCKEVFNVINNQ